MEINMRRLSLITRLGFLIALYALPILPAAGQISTDAIKPGSRTPPTDTDISPELRPSGLRITEVRDISASFSAAGSVYLDFTVDTNNVGDADGDFLLMVNVLGGERPFVSKIQHVESGDSQAIPVTFASNFDCRGADRFSIVVTLVDRWSGLGRLGEPLRPREASRVIRWVDELPSKLGKLAGEVHCDGTDPFAGGIDLDADLDAHRMVDFDPAADGFRFGNSFRNNWLPALDVQTGGLCGGMAYAALDYYYTGVEIPEQDYRPADHNVLYRYLYDRNQDAIESNLDLWFELRQNPGGIRNTTFFHWGLRERLADIREYIERGEPAVLGLKGAWGSGDHQVLAVGYFFGAYRGDLGDHQEDVRIFIYDPNFPGKTMTLVPSPDHEFFYYLEKQDLLAEDEGKPDDQKKGKYYQGYFVDRNYEGKSPPLIPNPEYLLDGLVYELIVGTETGGDDLRGGGHYDLNVVKRNGDEQIVLDVNGGRRWIQDYMQFVQIVLDEPVPVQDLKELRLSHRSGGAGGLDNWDINKVWVSARGFNRHNVYEVGSTPLIRFTGRRRHFTLYLNTAAAPDAFIRQINLTLQTGGDDLRGGNDNLDAFVLFTDGTEQRAAEINNFLPLRNHTELTYPIVLEVPRPYVEIRGIRLVKSRGGDNWNLDGFHVDYVDMTTAKFGRFTDRRTPVKRFTESNSTEEFIFD
jgi:hypothetical protein